MKQRLDNGEDNPWHKSSPAFCGGLIEAWQRSQVDGGCRTVFPRVLRGSH